MYEMFVAAMRPSLPTPRLGLGTLIARMRPTRESAFHNNQLLDDSAFARAFVAGRKSSAVVAAPPDGRPTRGPCCFKSVGLGRGDCGRFTSAVSDLQPP